MKIFFKPVIFIFIISVVFSYHSVFAQQTHQLYPTGMPPGVIGTGAAIAPPIRGYYQPVNVILPEGAQISFAESGHFPQVSETETLVGLLVGNVYRFKITHIPFYPAVELYPSIELIDRTYAPAGKELEFPIEVELSQEDLELAARGRFVVRIIYLENPFTALPTQGEEKAKLTHEAASGQNPLDIASGLGRPVAIVRLGSRVIDDRTGFDPSFFFGFPPLITNFHTVEAETIIAE